MAEVDLVTAEGAVEELRSLHGRIPEVSHMNRAESAPLIRAATIAMEFIHAAINALFALGSLRAAIGREVEQLRQEAEDIARWSQVLDEIDSLRHGVVGALRIRRYRLGTIAFRVYQLSQKLVLDKENAVLLPHLEAMKRAAKFVGRRSPRSTEPEPETPPTPPAK